MLIDVGDSHDLLIKALSVHDSWIDSLSKQGFMWNEKLHKVHFVMSGDMKFIQRAKGLLGANCNFSCPLCLKPKLMKRSNRESQDGGFHCGCDAENDENEFHHWKVSGELRSQEHSDQLFFTGAIESGDCWQHFGHKKVALLKSIAWSLIICETLHSLFRITDVLFENFLNSLVIHAIP